MSDNDSQRVRLLLRGSETRRLPFVGPRIRPTPLRWKTATSKAPTSRRRWQSDDWWGLFPCGFSAGALGRLAVLAAKSVGARPGGLKVSPKRCESLKSQRLNICYRYRRASPRRGIASNCGAGCMLLQGKRHTMRRRQLLLATATGMLALGTALPASAATTGTITIIAGSLSITVPASAGNLATKANTVLAETVSGSLGPVQVNDARNAAAGSGWVASVISTAFTPPSGPAIAASAVSYTAGTITKVGTATYTANEPPNLTGVAPAVTATGITGDNSATWNPTISVAVPGGTATGVYFATITHSIA
jgi:hypothetical protein